MTAQKAFQLAAWLCLLAIVALSLVSPSWRLVTILPHDIEHIAIFVAAGFALTLGYPNRVAQQLAGLVIFAAVVELAQFYAPGRHPRLIDFVVDALGGCAGVLLAALITRFVRPSTR